MHSPVSPDASLPSLARSSFESLEYEYDDENEGSPNSLQEERSPPLSAKRLEFDKDSTVGSDATVASAISSFSETLRRMTFLPVPAKPAQTHYPTNNYSNLNQGNPSQNDPNSPDPMIRAEDDIPIEPSCHGGLNLSPQQLAGIFAFFENGRSQLFSPSAPKQPTKDTCSSSTPTPPADADEDAMTTVTSNTASPPDDPKVERLEQEVAALQQIIHNDAAYILKLKNEFDRWLMEAANYSKEKVRLEAHVILLQREKDALLEQEVERLSTIEILKREVDQLTKEMMEVAALRKRVVQLTLENDLFALQIIELEKELTKTKSTLLVEKNVAIDGNDASVIKLTRQLQLLSHRLDDLENHPKSDPVKTLEAEVSQYSGANLLDFDTPTFDCFNLTSSPSLCAENTSLPNLPLPPPPPPSDCGGEVEVTLEGPVVEQDPPQDENDKRKDISPIKKSTQDSWGGGICDCLPMFSSHGEV
jgi:hypothetical protein